MTHPHSPTRLPLALLAGTGLLMTGSGLQNSLLALRAVAENEPDWVVAALASAYFAGFVLGAHRTPAWIRRVGHVRAFAALGSTASMVVLFHVLAVHPLPWMAGRFLSGLCISGMTIIVESWLNASTSNERRGRVLATYMIVVLSCLGGGQFLLAGAEVTDFTLFAVVSALFSAALIPPLMSTGPQPEVRQTVPLRVRDLARRSPVGAAAALVGGATWGISAGLGAAYAVRVGLPTGQVTLFAAVILAGALVSQWPIGAALDRVDRRLVVAVVAGLAALAALGLGLLPDAHPSLLVGAALVGATTLPLYSLAVAVAIERVGEDEMISASATIMLLSGVGSALGPVTVGVLQSGGLPGFPLVIGVVSAGLCLQALSQSVLRPRATVRRNMAGPLLPRTTVAISRMAVPRRRRGGEER